MRHLTESEISPAEPKVKSESVFSSALSFGIFVIMLFAFSSTSFFYFSSRQSKAAKFNNNE